MNKIIINTPNKPTVIRKGDLITIPRDKDHNPYMLVSVPAGGDKYTFVSLSNGALWNGFAFNGEPSMEQVRGSVGEFKYLGPCEISIKPTN